MFKGKFHVLTTLIFRQTVGWAGGYIQGGGHSPMGSKFGMGADQLLSMEVITTTGKFVTASPTQNEDLFWAMSGGVGIPHSRQSKATLTVDTLGGWHLWHPLVVDSEGVPGYAMCWSSTEL